MSSILREIAQLSNPDHLDYDTEDILPDFRESDSDQEENAASAGRQHYVQVRYLFSAPDIVTDTE
jgi:hypothetical protein